MQIDLFGATEASAVQPSAPPVITMAGAWVPPEAAVFDDALRRRSLVNAIAVLNSLRVDAVKRVLLASGFALSSAISRAAVIAGVQSDIVAAARNGMTGHELHASRKAIAPPVQGTLESTHTSLFIATADSGEKEVGDASTGESRRVRPTGGTEDRGDGLDSGVGGEPLDARLARAFESTAGAGAVPAEPGSTGQLGEGRAGGSSGNVAPVGPGNLEDSRDSGSASRSGVTPIGPEQPQKLTKAQLNAMFVTQMTDDQLQQAQALFGDGSRAAAIARQIAKRATAGTGIQPPNSAPQRATEPVTSPSTPGATIGAPRAGKASDYVLTEEDRIGQGGLVGKFKDNVRAIQLLRTLEVENRHAVGDEQRALARYVGWGGLKGVFDPDNKQWANQHHELQELLTGAEWAAASRSQLDAFYTPPVIANAMYSAIARMGFQGGRVLDPAVGVGNFFGLMPQNMRGNSSLHGVELDILTSQIVAALYPNAKIAKATGFQNYNVPSGYFDVVVGNPPYGNYAVADERGSAYSGWTIHNYMFAKSIEMLRPGGVMSMVVSHSFLDKLDPHVRQWIARRAELVSGVRLPNTAFKENANTEVVTDVLVFRRLDNENELGAQARPAWLETTDMLIENPKTGVSEPISINNYFISNPQNVLGTHSTDSNMHKANAYTVLPDGDLVERLAHWVDTVPQGLYVPLTRSAQDLETAGVEIPDMVKEGSFFHRGEEVWQRLSDLNGEHRAHLWTPPNERALDRMRGMIDIRNALRAQMRLERAHSNDNDIARGRTALNTVYNAFQKKHGYVNDPINRRLFLDDTESALIQALEFDYEKAITPAYAEEHGVEPRAARAVKADIFSRRVLFPPGEIEVVESAKDALLHSLNFTGGVDMAYMERAYSKDRETIIAELGDLIFMDPVEGLVTADRYLSGDVKTKLTEVRKAAEMDSNLAPNVAALERVIPADKLPSEIYASLGAAWIPDKYFVAFAAEISGATLNLNYIRATGQWLLSGKSAVDFAKNNSEYGTAKLGATDILLLIMNSRAPEVKKTILVDDVERSVTDEEQTEAARQCADKIRAKWDSWVWENGARTDDLAGIYNEKFNRIVERKYDGSHLTFPGMSPLVTLLSHQKSGVWRGLQDRVLLLDQVVGAGKTFECVALVMEMRRLGIAKKPLLAVPNHLTLQWRSDFYKLYPGANVLAATPQDFDKENRERFFSKIVTGNWDAVIIGHSSLKKIEVPLEAEMRVINEQLEDIASAVESMKRERGDRNIIRDMEKIKSNLEAKVKKLKEKGGSKDKVVDFGDLGVDGILVDELHEFKNLFFNTQMNRVAGLGNPAGSGKAFDLFVKVRWLQNTYGDDAPLITATGTPVSNSLAEMFTMQRYMQYNRLRQQGLHIFDAWAKQHGDVQNVYEVAPSGTGYRLSQRFAKFKNLGSLMSEYRSFADVVTLKDLKAQEIALGRVFPVPNLLGGKPQNVVVPRSALQERFFGIPEIARDDQGAIRFEVNVDLPTRIVAIENGKFVMQQDDNGHPRVSKHYNSETEAAYMTALGAITPVMHIDPESIIGQFENLRELTRRTKGKVNALSLTGLANKAGLDYRLIDPGAPDDPNSKVNEAIKRILALGKQWEADRGVQLIFCDLSVPLSAKAKMASKEKRVYVRDEAGALMHKKGTLHTLKEHEGLPYYLVAAGKGSARTYSMYDPVSGHLMRDGFDAKQAAHEFVAKFIAAEGGPERWIDMREQSRSIGADEIDEYRNEQALDADGDAADMEITREDLEGVAGVGGFSIYDDMKAKLIAAGVPEAQIEFIHDHDTPQAKALLFKRTNAGEVRYLFGSTPKMGAGTNVQERIVGLHNIDAPYRPSDLEQREGRGIRRGNVLYERDPKGFLLSVFRYATSQTYDTRRWQLLEHKAAGIEQLRNYSSTSGINEIEDVTTEASNSADMKAAASGNPLILKETQMANAVKTLRLLERAHRDGEYVLRSKMNHNIAFANRYGPNQLAALVSLRSQRDRAAALGVYGSKQMTEKEQVMDALDDISAHLKVMAVDKTLIYKGLKFQFSQDTRPGLYCMTMPNGSSKLMDSISKTGAITRMDNFCEGLEKEILHVEQEIEKAMTEGDQIAGLLGKPFDRSDELLAAIAEHGKVQRALRKSNSLAAVKPEEAEAFREAVDRQKVLLRAWGLVDAVLELEKEDDPLHNTLGASTEQDTGVVSEGEYNGTILEIEGGVVTQRVNRDGQYVRHSMAKLSLSVNVDDVVGIHYSAGVGEVTGIKVALEIE